MPAVCLALFLVLPAAEPPTFVLHTADGVTAPGRLRSVAAGWAVTLAGRTPAQAGASDLLALRRADVPLPPFPGGPQLLFANGDCLAGNVRTIARERVAVSPTAAADAEVSVPLSHLAVIWLADPSAESDPALLRRRLLTGERKRDAVWLRNGDVIEGTLTALDKDSLKIEVERREVGIERNKVAYVALNTELALAPRPKGTYARLTLADGSRLGLSSAEADADRLTCRTLFGADLSVAVEQVIALDLHQGRAVFLSDLKPRSYRHTPWSAGLEWPFIADGSVTGRALRLGGGTYAKGLGLHCGSTITYALNGAYQHFEALVGLDDEEGRAGVVRIRVLVDGKPRELGWDTDLTARDEAKRVRIRVAGAQELTLVVERGRGGWWDTQGHVNWVDARLIK